jgi:hypothetical protein
LRPRAGARRSPPGWATARRNGVNLPLLPIFCGQYRAFAAESAWKDGIDRFTAAAADLGPQAVALCLTPAARTASTALDDPRPHAVRPRARRLTELAEMPHRSWRLHQLAKEATTAAGLAKRGTRVLGTEGLDTQLHATAQDALARTAKFLRRDDNQQLTA